MQSPRTTLDFVRHDLSSQSLERQLPSSDSVSSPDLSYPLHCCLPLPVSQCRRCFATSARDSMTGVDSDSNLNARGEASLGEDTWHSRSRNPHRAGVSTTRMPGDPLLSLRQTVCSTSATAPQAPASRTKRSYSELCESLIGKGDGAHES